VRLALLGVRGSTPAPGATFVRYGGHTSCVAVLPDGDGPLALLLDAGTGARDLPALLGNAAFVGDVVLTHLHWDHVQGLPFCPSLDHPDARVTVHLPTPDGADAAALLARGMSPPHFPIGPDGLRGAWTFAGTAGGFTRGATVVTLARIGHRGRTHGVRVEHHGRSVAYLPDHSPATACPTQLDAAERLAADADVLLHDAQFTAAERQVADAYGHATVDDAVAFARRCGVRHLVLTHHAPTRTDDQLDDIARAARCVPQPALQVTVAIQGTVLDVR
jgi:ribonuclease BN (tRNA processing enzyme)